MEKIFDFSYNYDEEESEIVQTPYWWVEYIDNYGSKHLATVKDEEYVKFLQNNYDVTEVRIVR